jgi:hypothetical protein
MLAHRRPNPGTSTPRPDWHDFSKGHVVCPFAGPTRATSRGIDCQTILGYQLHSEWKTLLGDKEALQYNGHVHLEMRPARTGTTYMHNVSETYGFSIDRVDRIVDHVRCGIRHLEKSRAPRART